MNFKTIYSVGWYMFIGCFSLWLICGLGYKFLFNDTVEQSRMELTQALNAAFPREHYIIDRDIYDSNRRNLLSIGVSINIKNDSLGEQLRDEVGGGWRKVYEEGIDINGRLIKIHYFINDAGKIFNPKITQIDELKNLYIPLR